MSVLALAIAEEVLVSEYYLAFTGGLCLAPFNVGADIFRFALGDAAVDGNVKLGTGLIAVDALFLEVWRIEVLLPIQVTGDFILITSL